MTKWKRKKSSSKNHAASTLVMVEEKRVEVRNTHVNQIHCMRSPTLSHTRRRQKICVWFLCTCARAHDSFAKFKPILLSSIYRQIRTYCMCYCLFFFNSLAFLLLMCALCTGCWSNWTKEKKTHRTQPRDPLNAPTHLKTRWYLALNRVFRMLCKLKRKKIAATK